MNLELAEGTLSKRGFRRRKPIKYLPHPKHFGVMVREDALDEMEEPEFYNYLSEMAPELSEYELSELESRRSERKDIKMQKKRAKADVKQAKADKKRAKGEAKIIRAQAKQTKAETGQRTSFKDVIGGITDVAGAVGGVVQDIKGGGASGSESAPEVASESGTILGMPKKTALIVGGIVAAGVIFMIMKKKK